MRNQIIFLFILFSPFISGQENSFPWYNTELTTEERINSLVKEMTLEEKVSQLMDASVAIDRLGIPEYNWWNEALHGVARNGKATVFPQAIGLAATFDPELIKRVSTAISDEARAKFNIAVKNGNRSRYAGLTFWSPNVNIFRDPRWGRGQETYGEDPFLTSEIGKAFVRGLQGDNEKYLKVAACAKHYAVHSGPEELRHSFDAQVTQRDLYETYLPAFEALVVEADVEIVMGAYNAVNGEAACASNELLVKILRNDWGFDGHVVSDCGALGDIHMHHKITKSAEESAALALKMGVDLNCGGTYSALVKAVEEGLVDEETIDLRLKTLLKTRFKLGLMDPLEMNPYNSISPEVVCGEEHSNLALETARKSMVLLTNKNNVLPLSKNMKNLYITGPMANNSEVLLGNYYGMSNRLVNILEGLTSAVSIGTTINYKQGVLPFSDNINPIDWTTGEAQASDAIIAVLGISGNIEGEEGEAIASPSKGDRLSPFLPKNQIAFLKKLREGNDKPIIVVLTGGSPMIIPEVKELADAIIYAWYPGQEGGTAVADIIFGDISPSGKLPLSFLASEEDLPPYDDYSMKNRTYKYMEYEALFPFGFGLSYADFNFSSLKLNDTKIKRGSDLIINVDVENNSKIEAEEVIQVYITQPGAGKTAPLRKLVSFKRVKLKGGEKTNVELIIDSKQMQQYDLNGNAKIHKGNYKIFVGGNSPTERYNELGVDKLLEAGFRIN